MPEVKVDLIFVHLNIIFSKLIKVRKKKLAQDCSILER